MIFPQSEQSARCGKQGGACRKMFPLSALMTFRAPRYQNPALTTVRQPLREMGVIAAQILLRRINASAKTPYPKTVTVEPELIVRESTAEGETLGIAANVYLDDHANSARIRVIDELFEHLAPEFSSGSRNSSEFLSKYR